MAVAGSEVKIAGKHLRLRISTEWLACLSKPFRQGALFVGFSMHQARVQRIAQPITQ